MMNTISQFEIKTEPVSSIFLLASGPTGLGAALNGITYPPNLEYEKLSRANADLPGFENK